MGCYTQWYVYLQGAELEKEKKKMQAKFLSLKHAIDYYFAIAEKKLPNVRYVESASNYELIGVDEFSDADYHALCRHLACDEVHFTVLLDVLTILNRPHPEAGKYAYLLMRCLIRLRNSKWNYYPIVDLIPDNMQKLSETGFFAEIPK